MTTAAGQDPVRPARPVAVVSGGSHGAGLATTRALAGAGHDIVLLHSVGAADAAAQVAVELRATGIDALSLPVDVSDDAAVAEAFDTAVDRFGRVDVALAFAGPLDLGALDELRSEQIDRTLGTIVRGTLLMVRHAVRTMAEGGLVLTLSSSAVERALPGTALYVAARAAVGPMSRALDAEVGPSGVRVVPLEPGLTSNETALARLASAEVHSDGELADLVMRAVRDFARG